MKHVYMVRAGESQYKIGVTSNIIKRMKALQTSNGNKIELVTSRFVDNPSEVESELHKSLKAVKANGGKEWFELNDSQAIQLAINLNKYQSSEISEMQLIRNELEQHLVFVNKLCRKINHSINIQTIEPISIIKVEKTVRSDEHYKEKAKDLFKKENKASTSLLQRKLGIGYGRASRIVDQLEAEGYVSEANGQNPRMVLR